MKYFTIFLISLIFVLPAQAAKKVTGDVPEVQPLILPPEPVAPSYQNNIQMSDPAHPTGSQPQDQQHNSPTEVQPNDNENQPSISQNSSSAPGRGALIIIIILFLLVAGFFVYRKMRTRP